MMCALGKKKLITVSYCVHVGPVRCDFLLFPSQLGGTLRTVSEMPLVSSKAVYKAIAWAIEAAIEAIGVHVIQNNSMKSNVGKWFPVKSMSDTKLLTSKGPKSLANLQWLRSAMLSMLLNSNDI